MHDLQCQTYRTHWGRFVELFRLVQMQRPASEAESQPKPRLSLCVRLYAMLVIIGFAESDTTSGRLIDCAKVRAGVRNECVSSLPDIVTEGASTARFSFACLIFSPVFTRVASVQS